MILSVLACLLIWAFDASTDRLTQLYIIGVFVSSTVSQSGMVRHWARQLRTAAPGRRCRGRSSVQVTRRDAVSRESGRSVGQGMAVRTDLWITRRVGTKFAGVDRTLESMVIAFTDTDTIDRHRDYLEDCAQLQALWDKRISPRHHDEDPHVAAIVRRRPSDRRYGSWYERAASPVHHRPVPGRDVRGDPPRWGSRSDRSAR